MYTFLMHAASYRAAEHYLHHLRAGDVPGGRLAQQLGDAAPALFDTTTLLDALINTKSPQIFAESAVRGDGSDWNIIELSLLGDLGVAVPVSVFDDGRHQQPLVHAQPFPATLLFTPGALLRNDQGLEPADWQAVTRQGRIDQAALNRLYERRLLPAFAYIQHQAAQQRTQAIVTVPGLGCGQFAGRFRGHMGHYLQVALVELLQRHAQRWPNIGVVWFDPYNECQTETLAIHHLLFKVRPLALGHAQTPQLCPPDIYMEGQPARAATQLFSLVAWDPVSWPGNDFYVGARLTDDGVKAAATSAMATLTGCQGHYDARSTAYQPPADYRYWEELVQHQQLRLQVRNHLHVHA